ncbi:MAG: mechanosensitive ion channel [Thermodesulfovibrionales bacterium]|nr:mechanosensitive ion channel [Thermodesulfovibrionales bacterium]
MAGLIESLKISSSPYVNALLSIIAFIIMAKIIDSLIDKGLRRFTTFTRSELDDRIIDIIHRPVYFSIIIIGITLAIAYLRPSEKLLYYTNGILYSLLAVLWIITFIKIGNALIEDAVHRIKDVTGLGKEVIPLIKNFSKVVIIVLGLMVILSIWKINITPVLASAGIAGVAVAIAARDTLANFFGGLSLFVDKPFKLGDFIVIDEKFKGEVVDIGLRSTRIKTPDDILITIPNSILVNSKIINESAPSPRIRLRLPVNIAYGSDLDLAEKTIMDILNNNPDVLKEPAPKLFFLSFGESSLNLEIFFWIEDPSLRFRITDSINREIYKRFNEKGIKIPFPQREVYLHKI